MAMAYPQVLVSQRTLFQLQIGYLTALHEVWANAIALQNYTLNGGLDAPRSKGSPSTAIDPANSAGGSPVVRRNRTPMKSLLRFASTSIAILALLPAGA